MKKNRDRQDISSEKGPSTPTNRRGRSVPGASSRLRLLSALGFFAALLLAGVAIILGGGLFPEGPLVEFEGAHQAGVTTPQQAFMVFGAFDLQADDKTELEFLLKDWTAAARNLSLGKPLDLNGVSYPGTRMPPDEGAKEAPPARGKTDALSSASPGRLRYLPPGDTGEAVGLNPARLTLTFGAGPSLFDGRFGLASLRPPALVNLPAFNFDALDPRNCGGDLGVQICAEDYQVAFHALRNLTRIAKGRAHLRWMQSGFLGQNRYREEGGAGRNLQGFKDGSANLDPGDPEAMEREVWVSAGDGAAWMEGGTYLVVRRIRMFIEIWDRSTLGDQEQTIGRSRRSGASLAAEREEDELGLAAVDGRGDPIVPADAHVRLARGDGAEKILRRPYSFVDGLDERSGQFDAGLFFIAFQRDPRKQFIPMQRRLAASDALNEYIQHVGSAVFAVFPGVSENPEDYLGKSLLSLAP